MPAVRWPGNSKRKGGVQDSHLQFRVWSMFLVGVACAWPQPFVIPVMPAGQTLRA
jgi:hypothetical protein